MTTVQKILSAPTLEIAKAIVIEFFDEDGDMYAGFFPEILSSRDSVITQVTELLKAHDYFAASIFAAYLEREFNSIEPGVG